MDHQAVKPTTTGSINPLLHRPPPHALNRSRRSERQVAGAAKPGQDVQRSSVAAMTTR